MITTNVSNAVNKDIVCLSIPGNEIQLFIDILNTKIIRKQYSRYLIEMIDDKLPLLNRTKQYELHINLEYTYNTEKLITWIIMKTDWLLKSIQKEDWKNYDWYNSR